MLLKTPLDKSSLVKRKKRRKKEKLKKNKETMRIT